jgi:hypothetical protein
MGMTAEELTALNRINIYLRDKRGLSISDAFRIAKEIVDNREFIREVLENEIRNKES